MLHILTLAVILASGSVSEIYCSVKAQRFWHLSLQTVCVNFWFKTFFFDTSFRVKCFFCALSLALSCQYADHIHSSCTSPAEANMKTSFGKPDPGKLPQSHQRI